MRPRTPTRWLVTLAVAFSVTASSLSAASAAPADVLTGRIVAADDAPAVGALVRVSALDPAPPEGPYRDPEIGTALAGPDGRFAVPLVLTSHLRSLAEFHGGALNLWIHASRLGAEPTADLAVAYLDGTSLLAPAPLELTLPDLPADTTVPVSHHGCGNYPPQFTVVERQYPFEPIGEVHTGRDTWATFEYGERADTDLGGAYKPAGGNWSVGAGVSHMGNTENAIGGNMGPHFGKVQLTQFRYRKDRIEWCERGLTCEQPCRVDHRVVAEAWKGVSVIDGADVSHLDGPERFDVRKDEGTFSPGKFWDKKEGRGHKYTYDVQAFGVGLHAQSEWGRWVDIHYTFGEEPFLHKLFSTENEIRTAETVYAW